MPCRARRAHPDRGVQLSSHHRAPAGRRRAGALAVAGLAIVPLLGRAGVHRGAAQAPGAAAELRAGDHRGQRRAHPAWRGTAAGRQSGPQGRSSGSRGGPSERQATEAQRQATLADQRRLAAQGVALFRLGPTPRRSSPSRPATRTTCGDRCSVGDWILGSDHAFVKATTNAIDKSATERGRPAPRSWPVARREPGRTSRAARRTRGSRCSTRSHRLDA